MTIYYTLHFSGIRGDSHEMLKDAIAAYTGDRNKAEALAARMKTGRNGKPYIDGFDHFSISHSGKAWAVLFDKTECGLDIQYEKKCDILSVARRWYNPIDAGSVETAAAKSEDEGTKEFFRLWTRREALIKALGGSVCDTGLPPVGENIVSACGKRFVLKDIKIAEEEGIHAAICIRKEEYKDCDGDSIGISVEPDAYSL